MPYGGSDNGIGTVQLAFENGLFYVYMSYYHPPRGTTNVWPNHTNVLLSMVVYRFDYNAVNPYGFGGSVRQVFHNGSWEINSGRFVSTTKAGRTGLCYPTATT